MSKRVIEFRRDMRIQEMRSGISHLRKRIDDQRPNEILEMRSILEAELPPVPEPLAPIDPPSELDELRWAVVSFDRTEASGLTYKQALQWMSELDLQGVAGLCLITDEAAERNKA